jgi:hypothetical protein
MGNENEIGEINRDGNLSRRILERTNKILLVFLLSEEYVKSYEKVYKHKKKQEFRKTPYQQDM